MLPKKVWKEEAGQERKAPIGGSKEEKEKRGRQNAGTNKTKAGGGLGKTTSTFFLDLILPQFSVLFQFLGFSDGPFQIVLGCITLTMLTWATEYRDPAWKPNHRRTGGVVITPSVQFCCSLSTQPPNNMGITGELSTAAVRNEDALKPFTQGAGH